MQNRDKAVAVLFCCMGNICRSPTAEGVFRRQVAAARLENRVRIDSAGTHSYHVGHAPDPRSQRVATARGYQLEGLLKIGKVDRNDLFSQLMAVGDDLVGNVTVKEVLL